MKLLLALCLAFTISFAYAKGEIKINVKLTPAGSFEGVSNKLKGKLVKRGGVFVADRMYVSLNSFKTGIELRDEHFAKHLNASKHPRATLTNLKAQNGQGTAVLEVNNVKRRINISYTEKGKEVIAKFQVKNSEFGLPKAKYLGVGVEDNVVVHVTAPFIAQ